MTISLPAVDQARGGADGGERTEGDDERRQLQAGNEETVDEADERPQREGNDEPDNRAKQGARRASEHALHHHAGHHPGEAEYGAVGEVDAPGDDHERLADGQEQELDRRTGTC